MTLDRLLTQARLRVQWRARLRAAFLATTYGTPGLRFRLAPEPGRPSPLFRLGVRWAVLTAHNPAGRQQSASLNAEAQRRLGVQLQGLRAASDVPVPVLAGVNGEGEWAEASLIVPGLPLGEAFRLGRAFGQAAVLYGCGQRAALVWCGPDGGDGRHVERCWVSAQPHSQP